MKKFQLKRDLVSELYCQSGFSQIRTKLAIVVILASEALLREKNPVTKCYPQWE